MSKVIIEHAGCKYKIPHFDLSSTGIDNLKQAAIAKIQQASPGSAVISPLLEYYDFDDGEWFVLDDDAELSGAIKLRTVQMQTPSKEINRYDLSSRRPLMYSLLPLH